jgi:hypothetical protein
MVEFHISKILTKIEIPNERKKKRKKPASYSHRTATTTRPCYIPVLGDSVGAGRIRLAGAQRYVKTTLKSRKDSDKKSRPVFRAAHAK